MDCPPEDLIDGFLNGRLAPEQHGTVIEHLGRCARCTDLVGRMVRQLRPATEATLAPAAQMGPGPAGSESPQPPPAPPPAPAVPWSPPDAFDQFRLVRLLGKGAMGQVYEAEDTRLDRRVAIKFIAMVEPDHEARERFLVEARAMARVSHPNVITAYHCGEVDGRPYLVSELVPGKGLDAMDTPVPWQRALVIGLDLAQGLRAAHRCGVLHRDIKPANIILGDDGRAKLVDFGLAKVLAAPGLGRSIAGSLKPAEDASPSLTAKGALLGTPLYMAPEIWRGEPPTSRSDVYSLGMVLYEMCAGDTPYPAKTLRELKQIVESQDAPPLMQAAPGTDPGLATLVDRCLKRDPKERFASGEDLCRALEELAEASHARPAIDKGRSTAKPRRALAWVLAGSVAMAGLLVAGNMARFPSRPGHPSMISFAEFTFRMGSSPVEAAAAFHFCKGMPGSACDRAMFEREEPVRTVTLSPFRLDATEVTSAEFATWLEGLAKQGRLRVRGERLVELAEGGQLLADVYPTYRPTYGIIYHDEHFLVYPGFDRKPATQLTWEAAWRYCADHGKRLPTEAEWEFAARGAEGRRFPWGSDEPRCDGVVYGRAAGQECERLGRAPADVGTTPKDRSPEGVFDLGGNVSEWVMDAYHDRYPDCPAGCRDPLAQEESEKDPGMRVVRGGNWAWTSDVTRASARSRYPKDAAFKAIGFRCAAPAR